MKDLAEWIEAYREQALEREELLSALTARGACSEEEHRIELAWLARMRDDGTIDTALAGALREQLKRAQEHAAPDGMAAADAEATRLRPASATVVDEDAPTLLQAHGDAGPATADATELVRPRTSSRAAASPANAGRATVGMRLKGRFALERELGRGGMGVVYLARDERRVEARDRDPFVAIKVLNDEFRHHPDSLIALQREASRAQQLGHENIVRVYDFDRHGDIVFMTMEYIAGTDLRSMIREQMAGGIEMKRAWPLIEGMGRALQCAHDHRIVHSDFKPGNVMVTRAGVAKVFDFGIARASRFTGEHAGEQTVFDASVLNALTPAYASLDMTQGKPPHPGDDIYAFGCVIFELLGGRHPFGKLSAEAAMRERMRPPPLLGLSNRQYKALRDSVSFERSRRPSSAQALLAGLRPRRLRERLVPYLLGGALLALALAGGGWALAGYWQQHRVDTVLARLAPTASEPYRDERQAMQALEGLGEGARKRLVLDHFEQIQAFFLGRLDTYWNPAQGRQDYAGVQRVLDSRGRLRLFSPALDARKSQIEQQRNDLLNALDTRLAQAIEAGAIFEDHPGNAVELLGGIRMLDPASALLNDKELELKYEAAIAQSLDGQHFEQALQRLALARRLFPGAERLRSYQDQLDEHDASSRSAVQQATAMTVQKAHQELGVLSARPQATPGWQAGVANAMAVLQGGDHAARALARTDSDVLASGIVAQTAHVGGAEQVQQALELAATGLRYAPQSALVTTLQGQLRNLQQQREDELSQETANAELSSRIESARRAAAANDIDKVRDSLARIQAAHSTEPFLREEGPRLLSGAYLAQARLRERQGHGAAAAALVGQAMQVLGRRPELRLAAERYALAMALTDAARAGQELDEAGYQRLSLRYQAARRADAEGVAQLQDDLRAAGMLPQASLDALLAQLQAKAVTRLLGHAPVAAAANSLATPQGTDPCGQSTLAGSGRRCADTLSDGSRGPDLVVIPGPRGHLAFAMTRELVQLDQFNHYCDATERCKATRGAPTETVRRIYLSQARMYASWLTRMTGYTYRLPSAAEWTHAALAGGSCEAVPRGINGWGVQELTGRLGQWVIDGRHTLVIGGRQPLCGLLPRTDDAGAPQADVGFRLVRELQ